MIPARDFKEAQNSALASRRSLRQDGQKSALSAEITQRILRHMPKPIPPTLNANDQDNLAQLTQRNNIVLDSKVRVCRVEEIYPDEFTAIFSEPGLVDQRVKFQRNRVAPSDYHLLQQGAVFYWFTTEEKDLSGEIISTSHIRFRRRPRLSREEAKELEKMAVEAITAGGGSPISDEDLE
jgi:hypothetical protein